MGNTYLTNPEEVTAVLNTLMYTDCKKTGIRTVQGMIDSMSEMNEYTAPTGDYHDYYEIICNAVEQNPELGQFRIACTAQQMGYDSGTAAMVFTEPGTNNAYVVYRGTGDGEWYDDGIGLYEASTIQQKRAAKFFDEACERCGFDENTNLVVTGHSKGANKAQYVTMTAKHGDLIDSCYSFDGQGFSESAIGQFQKDDPQGYQKKIAKMESICGHNDYVNELGIILIPDSQTKYVITKDDPNYDKFMGYHDIKTMFYDGNGYTGKTNDLTNEQLEVGRFAENLSEVLMAMPPQSRKHYIDILMGVMELQGERKFGINGEHIDLFDLMYTTLDGFFSILSLAAIKYEAEVVADFIKDQWGELTDWIKGKSSNKRTKSNITESGYGRADFMFRTSGIDVVIENERCMASELKSLAERLRTVESQMDSSYDSLRTMHGAIKSAQQAVEAEAKAMNGYREVLQNSRKAYAEAERRVMANSIG